MDGRTDVGGAIAAHLANPAILGWDALARRRTTEVAHLPAKQGGFQVECGYKFFGGHEVPTILLVEILAEVVHHRRQRLWQLDHRRLRYRSGRAAGADGLGYGG